MEVSWNGGTPKSSIVIGCSIVNHSFGGFPFMDPPRSVQKINPSSACSTCCCFSLSRFWIISNDSSPLFHVMLEAHCVLPVEYDFFADYKACSSIWCCRWWLCVGFTMVLLDNNGKPTRFWASIGLNTCTQDLVWCMFYVYHRLSLLKPLVAPVLLQAIRMHVWQGPKDAKLAGHPWKSMPGLYIGLRSVL